MEDYKDVAGRSWWYTFWHGRSPIRRRRFADSQDAIRYREEILVEEGGRTVDHITIDTGGARERIVWPTPSP